MNQIEWRFFLCAIARLLLLSSNNLLINQMRPNMIIIMTVRFDGCFVLCFFVSPPTIDVCHNSEITKDFYFSRRWRFGLPNINRMYHISLLTSQCQIWCAIILNEHTLPMSNIISIESIRLGRRFHFRCIEFRFFLSLQHLIFRCFLFK